MYSYKKKSKTLILKPNTIKSCCVPPQDAPESDAAALEVSAGLHARNIHDMRTFLNLADFLAVLLPGAGAQLFCPWVFVVTTELQVQ